MTEHYIDSYKINLPLKLIVRVMRETYFHNIARKTNNYMFSINGKPNNKVSNIISTYNISSYILLKHALCVYVFVQVS